MKGICGGNVVEIIVISTMNLLFSIFSKAAERQVCMLMSDGAGNGKKNRLDVLFKFGLGAARGDERDVNVGWRGTSRFPIRLPNA